VFSYIDIVLDTTDGAKAQSSQVWRNGHEKLVHILACNELERANYTDFDLMRDCALVDEIDKFRCCRFGEMPMEFNPKCENVCAQRTALCDMIPMPACVSNGADALVDIAVGIAVVAYLADISV
jgi:hypothetical protein